MLISMCFLLNKTKIILYTMCKPSEQPRVSRWCICILTCCSRCSLGLEYVSLCRIFPLYGCVWNSLMALILTSRLWHKQNRQVTLQSDTMREEGIETTREIYSIYCIIFPKELNPFVYDTQKTVLVVTADLITNT